MKHSAAKQIVAVLLVKASEGELIYFEPGSQAPLTLPAAEFDSRLDPEIILFARSSA